MYNRQQFERLSVRPLSRSSQTTHRRKTVDYKCSSWRENPGKIIAILNCRKLGTGVSKNLHNDAFLRNGEPEERTVQKKRTFLLDKQPQKN
jgi:hypothetical protein